MADGLAGAVVLAPAGAGGAVGLEPGLELRGGHVDEVVELPAMTRARARQRQFARQGKEGLGKREPRGERRMRRRSREGERE